MANAFQRAANRLRDKAFGAPPAEVQPAGPGMPAPVDYSAEARAQLFARLNQFAQQRRQERQPQAQTVWQNTATQGRAITQTTAAAQPKAERAQSQTL